MSKIAALKITDQIRFNFIDCIQRAFGDELKADMRGFPTVNSKPSRAWDLLNRNLCGISNLNDFKTYLVHRGPWWMVFAYERSTGILYTFMRETRFVDIRKDVCAGKATKHYLKLLVQNFNGDLECEYQEESLFPAIEDVECADSDEHIIKNMLAQLEEEHVQITHHVVVLFNTSPDTYELTSIRAVMLDRRLNVFDEESWSAYIPVEESIVADEVIEPNAPSNNPSHGLKLKIKAIQKKEERKQRLISKKDERTGVAKEVK